MVMEFFRKEMVEKGIELKLSEWDVDISYANTLLGCFDSCGTNRYYNMLRWSKDGVKIWMQEEGCFHCNLILGPYRFSWNQIKKLSEAGEDIEFSGLKISIADLKKLLKLKDYEYKRGEDAEKILKILRE